jgi:hypothetical protein
MVKKIILLVSLIFPLHDICAQTMVYEYDNNGNLIYGGSTMEDLQEDKDIKSSSSYLYVTASPNPTNDFTRIKVETSDDSKIEYFIYDIMSQQMSKGVFSGSQNNIDLSTYKSGTYLIEVRQKEQKASTKVIKK